MYSFQKAILHGLPEIIRKKIRKSIHNLQGYIQPQKFGNRYIRSSLLIGQPNIHSWESATTQFILIDTREKGVSLQHNHVFDPNRNLIYEDKVSINPKKIRLHRCTHVEGTVAYLCNTSVDNYYHWLCLTLPLIEVYRNKLGGDPDFYYVGNASLHSWQIESLQKAGISQNKLITHGITAERIIALIPNRKGGVDESFLRFTRNLFYVPESDKSLPKKLYVGRGDTKKRPFLNENECMRFLQSEFGFTCTTMDHKSIQSQAELFRAAQVIIAPHGAALTNLLFSNPEAIAIELMPKGYENPCFRDIANFVGCTFIRLEGIPTEDAPEPRSLRVDVTQLKNLLMRANLHS